MEQAVLTYLSKMSWQDWATAASVVFGIVTLIAFLDQRRSSKQNQVLLEFAERHVQKDISEEQLSSLNHQRQSLEQQIAQELPALAKRAVLQEQREHHAKAAAEHYSKVQAIDNELGEKNIPSQLDPVIATEIANKLLPSLEFNRRRESLRSSITIYSVAVALSGSLLPSPLRQLLVAFLAVPLISTVIRLAAMEGTVGLRHVKILIYVLGTVIIFTLLGFGILLLTFDGTTEFGRAIGWAALIVGGGTAVVAAIKKRALDTFLTRLLSRPIADA